MKYKVNEIFKSLQGEGGNQGKEVVFIRLSGCNKKCEWCDTDHENYIEYITEEIIKKVNKYGIKSVIITGGEPLIHNLNPLLKGLKNENYWIGIESNGSIEFGENAELIDYITISPKGEVNNKKANEIRIVNDNLDIGKLLRYEKEIEAENYYISPLEINGRMNIKETMEILGKINEVGTKNGE